MSHTTYYEGVSMIEIVLYETEDGKSPITDYLNSFFLLCRKQGSYYKWIYQENTEDAQGSSSTGKKV